MNCQEVQAQLSDYVDRSLGASRLVLVEEHLAACAPCREDAELLGDCIRAVGALPLVDTPLGFTQRVMSHVRETESEAGFWQRFFLPFSRKIPAQAVAVVIVAVLGIYLLQKDQPQQPLPAPATITADTHNPANSPVATVEPQAPESSVIAGFENSLGQETAQMQPSRRRLQARLREESRPRVEKPAPPPVANVPDEPFTAPHSMETTVRPTTIVSGTPVHATPTPPETDSPAFRTGPATIEPFADLELILRRHLVPPEPQPDTAAGAVRKTDVGQASPRPIERLIAAIPDRTRPQTIWINVPEYQYETFKKELHALGIIESETRVPLLRDQAASHSDGQIRVKLTAVPAAETATPPTGR